MVEARRSGLKEGREEGREEKCQYFLEMIEQDLTIEEIKERLQQHSLPRE